MKRIIAVLSMALVMLGAVSLPASADEHVRTCGTWDHGTQWIKGCVFVNESNVTFANEAVAEFTADSGSNLQVEVDWVRIYHNGNIVNTNEFMGDHSPPYERSSDWVDGYASGGCQGDTDKYRAEARYRFKHYHGTFDYHTSGWIIRSTDTWLDQCP